MPHQGNYKDHYLRVQIFPKIPARHYIISTNTPSGGCANNSPNLL